VGVSYVEILQCHPKLHIISCVQTLMNGGVKVNKTDFEITVTEKHKLNLFLHHFISAQLYMHSVYSNSANFLGCLL